RSVLSLVDGIGIDAKYGTAAYTMKENRYYGHESALTTSVILAGCIIHLLSYLISQRRLSTTGNKKE
ncbi:hypothetical protein K501DRAFT_196637, partial [Backusella circina FSU 941]